MLVCPHIMQKVCHSATSMTVVATGDIVFNVGEIPPKPKMIVVGQGELTYAGMASFGGARALQRAVSFKTNLSQARGVTLTSGDWVAEATLWTHWMHRGILTATTDCRLCLVDSQKFSETVGTFDNAFNPKVYAHEFVRVLNRSDDLTDLATGAELGCLDKLLKGIENLRGRRRGGGRLSTFSSGSVVGYLN